MLADMLRLDNCRILSCSWSEGEGVWGKYSNFGESKVRVDMRSDMEFGAGSGRTKHVLPVLLYPPTSVDVECHGHPLSAFAERAVFYAHPLD